MEIEEIAFTEQEEQEVTTMSVAISKILTDYLLEKNLSDSSQLAVAEVLGQTVALAVRFCVPAEAILDAFAVWYREAMQLPLPEAPAGETK